jgi:Leucine-rich repeat (LRR) protein
MFILEVDQDDKKGLLRTKNLEHLGLTRFPPALFKMVNLQRLNISNNQITEIPDDIAHLKELRELDVSNNRIVALPPALGQLKDTLKSLRFHNNPLKTPPRDIIHKPVKIILGYLRDLQG